jgi:glycosyltransferase involved in cell wall biosynthesis
MKKISVLIPTYNEEEGLDALYERLQKLANGNQGYNFEFFFVNDGSSDKSLNAIKSFAKKDPQVAYISFSRNFGKEIAMIAGFDYVTGDATVIIDADLQDPPELIPKMIKYWEAGYDDVYARRRSRAGESWYKKKSSELFYKLLQKSTHIPIQQDTGDFRLLDQRCIKVLRQLRETQRYAKGMFSWIGFNKKEILYDRDPRFAGKTKWNYSKLTDLAINGITLFTTAPLRISSILGLVVSLVAFVYTLFLVFRTLFFWY